MKRIIHWFRRDLRISDNTALHHACKEAEEVIPVYILSVWFQRHRWTGPNRQGFLCGCIGSLAKNLEAAGGRLLLRAGNPVEELEKLVTETMASAIYYNRAYDPFGKAIEAMLATTAEKLNIEAKGFDDYMVFAPEAILTQTGSPFRVYSPYSRAWHRTEKPPLLPKIRVLSTPSDLKSLPLPSLEHWGLHKEATTLDPGERAARTRLTRFLDAPIAEYSSRRNFPATENSSRLSQDLNAGTISPRQVYYACLDCHAGRDVRGRASVNKFVNELVWREFYSQILAHYPSVLDRNFDPQYDALRWNTNPEALQRWSEGETGFPIVDAGMRELNESGYMHNRVRMIVAMFLTKDLHIHWREGESFFMRKLVDGNIASNNGGWQWSAGTGADASPYFRIQNPWTQTKNFDPEGTYIKRWLPSLRDIDPALLQRPPEDRLSMRYPAPMVDHSVERQETLDRFNQARERSHSKNQDSHSRSGNQS
jgi:deoxyribodipyrimidine photo-lyase